MDRYLIITFNKQRYTFRPCDTTGKTLEEVQALVNAHGYIYNGWLRAPGLGWGWAVSDTNYLG